MYENHNDIIDILLKSGADPALKDNEGRIAADFDYNKLKGSRIKDFVDIKEDL